MPSVTFNPLDWSTGVYVILMVLCLVVRWMIPASHQRHVRVIREVLMIAPAALFYFLVRGLVHANGDVALDHAYDLIEFEKRLGLFHEQQLQSLITPHRWLVDFFNWVYIWGHWPFLAGVFTWIVIAHPRAYPKYRNTMFLSGLIGMAIFALHPVAPPRLVPDIGLIDTVTKHSNSYRVFQPPALTNPYAAFPSLHFGWDLLVGMAVFFEARRWWARAIGIIMPVLMYMAIVLTANHYIIDGIAGGLLVVSCYLFVTRVAPIWQRSIVPVAPASIRPALEALTDAPPEPAPMLGDGVHVPAGAAVAVAERGRASPISALPKPFAVAHRFGNSLAALRLAEDAGADLVEADVWLYRGQLEVRHSKTAGPIPVLWDRWSLEDGRKPRFTLHQLLDGIAPETTLFVDLKRGAPGLADELVRMYHEHLGDSPLLVSSQDWRLLDEFREHPQVTVVHSIGGLRQLDRIWTRLERDDHDAVSIHYRLLSAEIVDALKERVSTVITWPINSEARLNEVLAWGVDGFTSDNVELIRSFVERRDGLG
ncbi:MAG TPA: phosphatase PAP2 family protein [Thermomicrobiales bacterium]|nr:phosphatase PAP2 family protein [Thermomicrobiales bacterium]